jgi:FAD/FMN-containing dehydrogenase
MSEVVDFGSWGRVFAPVQDVRCFNDRAAGLPLPETGSILAYGMGRSYGDSCLNDGNTLIRARGLDRLIGFDTATGVLRCEAGVTLEEVVRFALPRGFFLAVTPGTKYVTVGGAIANDVHGKNHHRAGSFGHHVERFELLRSDGSRTVCSPTENAALFRATVGGLGLTGLVTWADIRLRRVRGSWMRQRAVRFRSLEEFFALCEPMEKRHEYTVAWVDCTRGNARATRGVFFAGDHDPEAGEARARRARGLPFAPPFSLVNAFSLRAFNAAYYRMPRGGGVPRRVALDPFFYPLDAIGGWNRLYGPNGFFQYQCAVPGDESGRAAIGELLDAIGKEGQGSFLAVLKRFGDMEPAGLLSFPRPGYTFALDFPNGGAATLALLDRLDAVVLAANGRVYAAKDSRMSAESFGAFYPESQAFREFVDPRFSSSFWRRVTGGERMAMRA